MKQDLKDQDTPSGHKSPVREISTFVFDHMMSANTTSAGKPNLEARMTLLTELMKAIAPKNPIEEMLLSQMVLTYEVSMASMRRANETDDPKIRTNELNIAMKFSRLFADQLKTLYMYRQQIYQNFVNDRERTNLEKHDSSLFG